eukprot:Colp12_sorted_trinity150504_noHs@30909
MSDTIPFGSLVWGKVGGFPYWPALVVDHNAPGFEDFREKKDPDTHLLQFFGTYDVGWALKKNVSPYDVSTNERIAKGNSKAFKKAVVEATEFHEKGILPLFFQREHLDEAPEVTAADVGEDEGSAATPKKVASRKRVTEDEGSNKKEAFK